MTFDPSQLPTTWKSWAAVGLAVKWAAELYSSIKAGGGLKRIVMSFWFGEQIPKPIADDYKPELSKPPFNPPDTKS